jgi:hypothetical protein
MKKFDEEEKEIFLSKNIFLKINKKMIPLMMKDVVY